MRAIMKSSIGCQQQCERLLLGLQMFNAKRRGLLLTPIIFICFVFFYNEYYIYWRHLSQCEWPNSPDSDASAAAASGSELKMVVLSDTHLLGSRNGHWFDKLRREWQQHRAFQTAMSLFKPDYAVITGDLTDEGKWCSDSEWDYYEKRTRHLFRTDDNTELLVVVGNHDIGFHFDVTENKLERFNRSFKASYIDLYQPKKFPHINFVIVNSMAMENDRCKFCNAAQTALEDVNKTLSCLQVLSDPNAASEKSLEDCRDYADHEKVKGRFYSQPIVFNHYPLYRDSDNNCPFDIDTEYAILRHHVTNFFQQNYDCMSFQSSKQLLSMLNPRVVFDGHTHYSCYNERHGVPEYTLASFSWRNILIPSFLLVKVTEKGHSVRKCFLPSEQIVINVYIASAVILVLYFALIVVNKYRIFSGLIKIFTKKLN